MPVVEPDFSLPEPSPADQAKSLQLIAHLRQRMSQAPLSFAEYMAEVLYHPTLGYYSSGQGGLWRRWRLRDRARAIAALCRRPRL
ncbi:hypothetical protein A9404_00005 [Halothiobacillus diazotrophicus]|uniref:Uncharacterized protein n=1 Tax=Halothiobacillus diazotrophicus TaxID=1860122 RepID=A0A191ZK02_9GAMM|nr:hypothetical protein [Halothiobacillus diazotrophicus]ANJ68163.1 hypothetical protein A9404_00005 [Halothiobacillus diazotrophicus]